MTRPSSPRLTRSAPLLPGFSEAAATTALRRTAEEGLLALLRANGIPHDSPDPRTYLFLAHDDAHCVPCEVRFREPRFAVWADMLVTTQSAAMRQLLCRINSGLVIGAFTQDDNGRVKLRVSVNHAGIDNAEVLLSNALRDAIRVSGHYRDAILAVYAGTPASDALETLWRA